MKRRFIAKIPTDVNYGWFGGYGGYPANTAYSGDSGSTWSSGTPGPNLQPGYPAAGPVYPGYPAVGPTNSGYPPPGPGYPPAGPGYPPAGPGYPAAGPAGGYPAAGPPYSGYQAGGSIYPGYPAVGPDYPGSTGYPGYPPYPETSNTSGAIDEKTGISDVQNGFPHKPGPQVPVTPQDEQQTQKLRETFHRVAGEDMEIDAHELRDVLNAAFMREFKFDGFSMETCRSMVAMMDVDQSGKLGFEEFQKLWNDLRLWKSVFKQFDKDMSGTLNSYELRNALNNVGMRVSNQTFNALVMRFADKHGAIFFDDFILCAVRLKTMFDTFTSLDPNKTGTATFTLDQFIQTTMYS